MDCLLDGRSILLIGNGGSLKGSGLGSKIDEFDEVIRINEGKTLGWEKDVGTKFTIWSTYNPEKKFYKYFEGYKSRGYSDEQIKNMLKEVKEVWYVHPHEVVSYRYLQLNKYLSEGYVIRNGTKELIDYVKQFTPHSTTGFILINLLNLLYDRFYLTGFDFMGLIKSPSHHYFTDAPLVAGGAHNWDKEFSCVNSLVLNNNIEFLTKDTPIEKSKLKCNEEIYLK